MFTELKWLPFSLSSEMPHVYMVYKGLNDLSPEYITDLFVKTSEVHSRNLRSIDDGKIRVPKRNGTLYENYFAVSAVKLWNSLPTTIRNSNSLKRFIIKTTIKVYLLNEASKEPEVMPLSFLCEYNHYLVRRTGHACQQRPTVGRESPIRQSSDTHLQSAFAVTVTIHFLRC